ncbi:glycosyltransferase [Cryomorphaceae bacterium 1068]|nr:glycosyltransferase [Cryomorphaceae bacterium 1068]
MKVCLINTNRKWGGGEKWHSQTALKLAKKGYEVTMIAYPNSSLAQALRNSVEVLEFKIGKLSFLNPQIFKRLRKLFNTQQFDAIIMNLPSDVKVFAKPASKSGIKKIIYRRGMNHPIKASWLNRYIYKTFITDIIANSEDVKRSVFRFIPELEKKITVLPNGIDISKAMEKSPPRSEKLLIGNLGRLVEQKGQSDLIELGALLQSEGTDFHIHIGGEGPLRSDLENEIERLGLQNHITLLGEVKPPDFFPLIDYFVFPSRFEGLSNAMLESLQYGKPIICYDIASNSEIVENDVNGYLVKPYEVENIKTLLLELRASPEKYASIQNKGWEILQEKFDEKKLFAQLEQLIQSKP